MKIFIIAQIIENKKVIGYRLLDVDDHNKVQDYPLQTIKGVLNNKETSDIIKNASLVNGEIVGTNGQLSRYPKINRSGQLIKQNESPLIVINKIENIGYTVCDFKGTVKKMKTSDVVNYAKSQGIANGKVVVQDNVEYISSISDSYEQIKIAPSKVGRGGRVNLNIPMGRDGSEIAKHAANEINTELQYNDVFSAMNKEQRDILKQYYTWYTVDVYKSLARNVRLSLAPGKAEKLAQLRGIDKWQFAGVNDSYLENRLNAKCELGHNLRYEYFAIPEDLADGTSAKVKDWGNWAFRTTRGTQDDLRERGAIVFGETCAGDFFNIAPEDMKKLVKTRKIMSDEIELTADIITNKTEQVFEDKYKFLTSCIQAMGNGNTVVKVFGNKVGYTLLAFTKAKIPYTKSLVILAGDKIRENKQLFFKSILKDCDDIIDKVFTATERDSEALNLIRDLLVYITDFTIEGDYKYDPINDDEKSRRDRGAYNKDTRQNRRYTLQRLYSGTLLNEREFESIKNIENLLKTVDRALKVSIKAEEYVRQSDILKERYIGEKAVRKIHIGTRYEREVRNYISKDIEEFGNKSSGPVNTEDLHYIDVLKNCMSFNKELSCSNRFTVKTYEYLSKYRTSKLYKDFNELMDIFNNTLKSCTDDDIQKLLNKSLVVYENSLIDEQKRKELEQKRLESEAKRAEEEAKKKLEEAERKAEEARKMEEIERKTKEEELKKAQKELELAKKNKEKIKSNTEDKLKTLKDLLDKYDGEEDYGIKVAKDIASRYEDYNDLSNKQKWRIDDTLERLKALKDTNTNKEESGEDSSKKSTETKTMITKTQLKDSPEIENKVNKLMEILNNNDMKAYNKIIEASMIAFDVARTIKYKGEFSEKQLKHINKAYDKVLELEKEN